MIAAIVVVALVGGWAYSQMRGSLRDLRAAGLASLLEAESRGLQLWIDEKKRDAERWAATPRVRHAARTLAAARGDPCAASAQKEFRDEIAPYVAMEEVSAFHLVGRDGRILAALEPSRCGASAPERVLRSLAPVFEGATVFARDEATSWVEAPLRGEDGTIVAALGFGRSATQRLTDLLSVTAAATSRDAFAFDEEARLVTHTRHARELAVLPRTPLVEAALAHAEGTRGVILDPYSSYRGAQVIGAWRWLPESRIAVAVEIEAAEAYGPLESLPIAFGTLLALVIVSMIVAASASLWAVRARMREAQRVGQYRIEREIGEGGMSRVYFARHALLDRPAAVKVLKQHLATDEAVARFRREAQLCSQLSHPNTVEIYDYGTTRDGRWYYAMEYLRGISIEELVRRDGPMPAARVVHALQLACGSLKEAHDRGWVHRDVKPSNLMLCVRGGEHDVVKVVDFGLVKQLRDPHTRDLTQYSRILGTPLYMAPERLRNPADADARSDIYALAAVAWFALVGRPAFDEETDHAIIYRVLNERAPELPESVPARVRELLGPLIARCLEKDRNLRPATIEEVRQAIEPAAAEMPWSAGDARAWWAAQPPV
jgi:tRNA A-37 threonylcarbamoyl transferase component Bud32